MFNYLFYFSTFLNPFPKELLFLVLHLFDDICICCFLTFGANLCGFPIEIGISGLCPRFHNLDRTRLSVSCAMQRSAAGHTQTMIRKIELIGNGVFSEKVFFLCSIFKVKM